ncbi:hypothetical protein chiPu_0016430 [Chiloscyllium punctatum]|uniref:Secreted protein n=1 Tax=Chiloscyllium punctatum TaxID=137246 RepID=A0A401T5N0_CHIPU|nr:hypothetical protein [Chiloscyllium punctatum]
MGSVSGGMRCMKYLLFTFNLFFWVSDRGEGEAEIERGPERERGTETGELQSGGAPNAVLRPFACLLARLCESESPLLFADGRLLQSPVRVSTEPDQTAHSPHSSLAAGRLPHVFWAVFSKYLR